MAEDKYMIEEKDGRFYVYFEGLMLGHSTSAEIANQMKQRHIDTGSSLPFKPPNQVFRETS